MSYRTWYDPPRKGDEEPFPGSPDDMMNTVAALCARVAKLEEALKTARDYIRSTMKLVHRQRAQETIKAIDATLAAEPASGEAK